MKFIKAVVAVLLAVIFGFITRYYMSSINLGAVNEFTPIPHFFPTVDMSYKVSLLLLIVIYLLFFSFLVMKKYFNFAFSMLGMILGLLKYKAVTEVFLPLEMVFVPALLEFAKVLFLFMGVGIIIQWIVDGGLAAVKLVNKNKK